MEIPQDDLKAAQERSLQFKVTKRDKPRARWETVEAGIPDLAEAYAKALALEFYQSAIWLMTEFGNFQYWSSDDPDLFNSTILKTERH